MIHQPGYVKELIKKYAAGSITGVELERLKACWKIYEEEELLNMTAEVLYAIGKQQPADALEGWAPDFAKITSDAQSIRRNKKMLLYFRMAGAACLLLLLVMVANHFMFEKWTGNNAIGACGDIPSRSEIPGSEFACTIRWGDDNVLTIDSSSIGLVTRINNLGIRQEAPGVLVLTPLPGTTPVDTTKSRFVEVLTAARRQYIIKLPGSTSIHLNAGSSLRFPFMNTDQDICYVQLSGEAYIEMPGKGKPEKLVVETYNGQLQTGRGDFAVSALPGYTKTTLISGSLVTFSRQGIHKKDIDCPGDQTIVKSYGKINDAIADSLFFKRNRDVGEALAWTKANRNYRNVSLRQFVLDMSRWYGFTVQNINCIPKNMRVNTSICYRAPVEQAYAVMRQAGLTIYERNGMISFCDPKKKGKQAEAMVMWRYRKK